MNEKREVLGFGFSPEDNLHHFIVCIPTKNDASVMIYERFDWQKNAVKQNLNELDGRTKAKAQLSKHKWKMLEDALKTEFNTRLKKRKESVGKFSNGQVVLNETFGKELLVLVWSIEDCDPSVVHTAIRNWLGLAPEERWWLYTMTNAATGNIYDRSGWRKALRYALTENPVEECRQRTIFDIMLTNEEE